MSCPLTKEHQQKHLLNVKSNDGKCPARECPVLKEYVEKKSQKTCFCECCECNPCDCDGSSKCPFLNNHECSYLKNMK